jgi:hypothetical protein
MSMCNVSKLANSRGQVAKEILTLFAQRLMLRLNLVGQSHMKYERIAVSGMEARSDGQTSCSKHSQTF